MLMALVQRQIIIFLREVLPTAHLLLLLLAITMVLSKTGTLHFPTVFLGIQHKLQAAPASLIDQHPRIDLLQTVCDWDM